MADEETQPAEPVGVEVVPTVHRVETADEAKWRVLSRIANSVANTEFVPGAYRGRPLAVLACLAYGRELGLGEMQSLQSIHVIDGKPSLSPEAMRALVRAAGHRIETETYTDECVVLVGTRTDGSSEKVGFSMDDAKRAGLVKEKSAWLKYPRAMLSARATSELCRLLFSDVIMGASYTPEELGDEPVSVESVVEVSGSSSRPREPEAVEGGRDAEKAAMSTELTRSGEEHTSADPARPPSPPQEIDAETVHALATMFYRPQERNENLIAEVADLVSKLATEAKPAYIKFLRDYGIASSPSMWTTAHAQAIRDWCWTPLEVPA